MEQLPAQPITIDEYYALIREAILGSKGQGQVITTTRGER